MQETKVEANIEIEDVGPIRKAVIPIVPGTIVKLVGENGSGKSTAIQAVSSAVTKQYAGLRPRDGRMSGKVRMPGVTVSIGARMTRKETGEDKPCAFAIVEDGSGISKILSPGIKDPVSADKRRLEGVLDVIGATLSDSQMRDYLGGLYDEFVRSRDVSDKGFVDAVKEMKLFLDGKAREHARTVAQCDGAIAEIGVIPESATLPTPVEDLAQQIEQLSVEVRDGARDRELARKAMEALGAESAAEDMQKLQEQLVVAEQDVEATQRSLSDLNQKIQEIRNLIAAGNERLAGQRQIVQTVQAALESARKAEDRTNRLKEQVGNAMSSEQLQEKQSRLQALRTEHEEAIRLRAANEDAAQSRRRLGEAIARRESAEHECASLRVLAAGTSRLLRDAIETVPGWTVDDDLRLCVEHSRGRIPFAELSPGEGTARVCLLACQFAQCADGEIPIVGLPQACFEGLDGRNRQLLLEAARKHGLCILTAECDTNPEAVGGLRVEMMT